MGKNEEGKNRTEPTTKSLFKDRVLVRRWMAFGEGIVVSDCRVSCKSLTFAETLHIYMRCHVDYMNITERENEIVYI